MINTFWLFGLMTSHRTLMLRIRRKADEISLAFSTRQPLSPPRTQHLSISFLDVKERVAVTGFSMMATESALAICPRLSKAEPKPQAVY